MSGHLSDESTATRHWQVDQVCDRFERAWQAGQRPNLADYLDQASSVDRESLLVALIAVDAEYRRAVGESPHPNDYHTRWPELPFEAVGAAIQSDRRSTLETAPRTNLPASTVGDFEILTELGRGAMGVVFRARQSSPKRIVALKVIRADWASDPEKRALFRREADAVAALQHPNIVQVFTAGETSLEPGQPPTPFLAMELVEGGNLLKRLERRPIAGRDAASLVQVLALAMGHAHERGIVHRDLKPENVLLTSDGTPKITDFGLAKQTDALESLIRSGAVVGTPAYMSPEQALARQHEVGPRSDVYALGAILYECLTGRPPFLGATVMDTLQQVVGNEPAPPRQLNPLVERDLETICLKCLHKEPRHRYDSALSLAGDLRRYLSHEPVKARPVGTLERGWRWCRRNPAVAGLLATVVVVLLAGAGVATAFGLNANAEALHAQEEKQTAEYQREEANKARKTAQQNERLAKTLLVREASERDLKERQMMTAQFMRVAAVYGSEPSQGLRLLYDLNACPIDKRDATWRFYERCSRRWEHSSLEATGRPLHRLAFSPDGRTLALAADQVRLWDLPSGRVSLTLPRFTYSVCFSPDGATLASGSVKDVQLWDAKTGRPSLLLKDHPGIIHSLAYSPDGQVLAAGCGVFDQKQFRDTAGEIRLWDVKTGTLKQILQGHTCTIWQVSFSPDGRTLASCSGEIGPRTRLLSGQVCVWNAATGRLKFQLQAVPGSIFSVVNSVVFSPEGELLATGSNDAVVRIWDINTGQMKASLYGHTSEVKAVAVSPDGLTIASGGHDKTVRLWDVRTGQTRTILQTTDTVYALAFSPDGSLLGSGCFDGSMRLWDMKTQQSRATLAGHSDWVSCVAFLRDGQRIASGSSDKSVRLWNVKTGETQTTLDGHTGNVTCLAVSPDGHTLASGSGDKTIRLWNTTTGQTTSILSGHTDWLRSVAFAKDGLMLASASDDQTARLWDIKSGEAKKILSGHTGQVLSIALGPDGQTVATGSADNTARLWNATTGEPRAVLRGHAGPIRSVKYSPDGKTLASGSDDGTVRLWDTSAGLSKTTLHGHTGPITSLAFLNGDTLASGSEDATIRLWDTASGQSRATLEGHASSVSCVDSGFDGRTLASGSLDHTVRLWDMSDTNVKAMLVGHKRRVNAVVASPDGQTLATASEDQSVRLWDVRTWQPRTMLQGHKDEVRCLAYSADGETLATGSRDKTVRLWNLKTEQVRAVLQGHTQAINFVAFSTNGDTIFGWDSDERILAWSVRDGRQVKADMPPPRPSAWTQCVVGTNLNAEVRGSVVVIIESNREDDDTAARWAFEPSHRISWHARQAEQAEQNRDWFAAEFHLGRLLKAKPDDAEIKRRRDQAMEKRMPAPPMEPLPRP